MTEKEFDLWGVLGEPWWQEQGRLCRCNDRQRKFAAALYAKCTQAKAAEIAGYPGDLEQLRVQGSRAAASDRVRDLLALAEAQEGGAASEDLITAAEIDRRLSRMIRSPDPGTSLKATELWHKLEDRKRSDALEAAKRGEGDPRATLAEIARLSPALAAQLAKAQGMDVEFEITDADRAQIDEAAMAAARDWIWEHPGQAREFLAMAPMTNGSGKPAGDGHASA
jgi:hypothetical protein